MNTAAQLRGLHRLAGRVRVGHMALSGIAVRQGAHVALAEALLVGSRLVEARKLLGNSFDGWLRMHLPDIGPEAARSFMRVAGRADTLSDEVSVRRALQVLGIVAGKEDNDGAG